MVYQYRFHAPGSELHGEPFEIQDETRARADNRASARVRDTFALASVERRDAARAEFVAEFVSRRSMEFRESGKVCKRHDFRDGDVCSRCDEMRGVA